MEDKWPDDRESLKNSLLNSVEGIANKVKKVAPKSTIIKRKCPSNECGKIAIETNREELDSYVFITLECGHMIILDVVQAKTDAWEQIQSLSGKKPRKYQIEGAKFVEARNGEGWMICDDMGLGKTIQALILLKMHPEKWPFMIVAKAAITEMWFRQILDWLGLVAQILDTGTDIPLLPGVTDKIEFQAFIISVDTLSRCKWVDIPEMHNKIKTIIIDECQTIKSDNAKRTKAVRKLCEGKEVGALSGTPIDNHAAEYFNILNIVKPTWVYARAPFIREWVELHSNGRLGGIKRHKLPEWKRRTAEFIIRRTKKDVDIELPAFNITNDFVHLGKEVAEAYNKVYEQFEDLFGGTSDVKMSGFDRQTNLLGFMSRMRHIVGIAKIEKTLDDVKEFLDSNDRKLVVFTHHVDVAEILVKHIQFACQERGLASPLHYGSHLNSNKRQEVLDIFKGTWTPLRDDEVSCETVAIDHLDNSPRIMVASTQAGGVGVDLHWCQDTIIHERMWTPGAEKQAMGRFSRIGARFKSVYVKYNIAIDTIDELISEINERKSAAMSSTLDGVYVDYQNTAFMQELMGELFKKGRVKRWSAK